MLNTLSISSLLTIWLICLIIITFFNVVARRPITFLLAYFFLMSLIHVPGAINYLGYAPGLTRLEETEIGFQVTVGGFLFLTMGAAYGLFWRSPEFDRNFGHRNVDYEGYAIVTSLVGALTYFVALPAAVLIPSLTSILSPMASLLIIGLFFWAYAIVLKKRRVWPILVVLPALPLSTTIIGGFAGFGIAWALSVLAFVFTVSRTKWVFLLLAPFAAYAGISLGAAYLIERNQIRDVVWYQQASLETRWDSISKIADRLSPYDLSDSEQIAAIDARLNQNILVGATVIRHDTGAFQFMAGTTIPIWIFVPRIIWPDKPQVGGSGSLVSDMTGFSFAEGTSVGIGQVLEFYGNFGWWGVFGGFFLLGFVLSRLDAMLISALNVGNLRRVVAVGLPGLALLNPGGSLSEMLVTVVAAIAGAFIFGPVLAMSYTRFRLIRRARD